MACFDVIAATECLLKVNLLTSFSYDCGDELHIDSFHFWLGGGSDVSLAEWLASGLIYFI